MYLFNYFQFSSGSISLLRLFTVQPPEYYQQPLCQLKYLNCFLHAGRGGGRARRLAPRPRAGATCTLSADSRRCAKDAQIRAEENIKQISLSKILMLIEERRQRQHSPTFDKRLTYEDTDPNFRHNIQCIPPRPMHRAAAAIGRSWRVGRLSLPSPCPCHRCRRASSAHSRTHSHYTPTC